jgi:hypothetical protein
MSWKFFPLPGIFPLKIENHFQKISQKNFAERVLDLLLAPGRTVTGENGSVTWRLPRPLLGKTLLSS